MRLRVWKKGHTCLSLQDHTKGWYAGERHTWGTHMSLPTRPHKRLVIRRWEIYKNVKMRDAHISLYKTAHRWETQKCEKRDTHVSPYKTAQMAGMPVRNVQKYEHIKETQLHINNAPKCCFYSENLFAARTLWRSSLVTCVNNRSWSNSPGRETDSERSRERSTTSLVIHSAAAIDFPPKSAQRSPCTVQWRENHGLRTDSIQGSLWHHGA